MELNLTSLRVQAMETNAALKSTKALAAAFAEIDNMLSFFELADDSVN